MATKKEDDIKKTTKKAAPKKPDKAKLEEIQRKKEELLKRINAEIGEEEPEVFAGEDELAKGADDEKDEEIQDNGTLEEEGKEVVGDEDELREEEEKNEEIEEKHDEGHKEEKEENVEEREERSLQDEQLSVEDLTQEEGEDAGQESRRRRESVDSTPFSAAEFGIYEHPKRRTFLNVLLFLIVFGIVAGVSAFVYFNYMGGVFNQKTEEVASPTPTQAPTATPIPAFDRAEVSVQVLNGSGEAGTAGDAEAVLEKKGYENIETGNADNFDYENVTIQLKEELKDSFGEIKSDLEEDYVVNDEPEILEEDSEYDVVIIVGTEVDSGDSESDE